MRRAQNMLHSPGLSATHPRSSNHHPTLTIPKMRERQTAKIRQIADALPRVGLRTLDQQAKALGLLRSTAWNLLRGNQKASGMSARTINRILAAPRLPPVVRAIIHQYVAEKTAGLYGDNPLRSRRFTAQLGSSAREHAGTFVAERGEKSARSIYETDPAPRKFHKRPASHQK
jgi:hypothetical protein